MNKSKSILFNLFISILLITVTTSIVSASLVAQYPMTQGQGTILTDISGNSNNAAISGSSWQGNVLNFDGTTDFAQALSSSSLNITSAAITIMAWIKWDIDPKTGNNWATFVNMNSDNQYRLQHNKANSSFEFAIRTTAGNKWIISTTAPQKDQWYHIAGSYDGSTVNMYVNGQLENSATHNGTILGSNSPLTIGNWPSNDRCFAGSISDVRIYNNAVTQADIAMIATYPPTLVPEPATVAMLALGALTIRKRKK